MSHEIHNYTELEQQIHDDLRKQHPEWIDSSGKCPECDVHDARLKKMLEALGQTESGTGADQRVPAAD